MGELILPRTSDEMQPGARGDLYERVLDEGSFVDPDIGLVVGRYAEVKRLFGEPDTFSNFSPQHPWVPGTLGPRFPLTERAQGEAITLFGEIPANTAGSNLPIHNANRQVMDKLIPSGYMRSNEALGEDIGRRVEGWIDRGFAPEMEGLKLAGTGYVALKGSVDIMPGVHELTGQFMADWLGFPDDERERLALILGAELQVDLLGRKLSEEEQLLALAGFRGLWHRTQRLVDNTSPGEESYTARALQHQDPDQVKGAVANLMVAGARTTAESISNAMRYVAEHPDVWDAAVRNPEQMHNLAAELLRLEGGIFNWGRVVVEPTELGGIELEPGTPVMGMIGSSNRDPRHFGKTPDQDPRKVILDRKQRNTTVFGSGVRPPRGTPPNPAYRFNSHFCVGAGMAQTFVTRVFSQLAQQELRLVLPQPNPPMKPNVIFLEHEELPLAVESMRPHLYPV